MPCPSAVLAFSGSGDNDEGGVDGDGGTDEPVQREEEEEEEGSCDDDNGGSGSGGGAAGVVENEEGEKYKPSTVVDMYFPII